MSSVNDCGKIINKAKACIGIIGFVVVFCFVSTLQLSAYDISSFGSNSSNGSVPEWQRTSSNQNDDSSETGVCSLSEKLLRYQVFSDEVTDQPILMISQFNVEWLPTQLAYYYRYFKEYVYLKTRLHLRLCCFLE